MKSINILLSDRQFEELFQYFDKDLSGTIEYDEFLISLAAPFLKGEKTSTPGFQRA